MQPCIDFDFSGIFGKFFSGLQLLLRRKKQMNKKFFFQQFLLIFAVPPNNFFIVPIIQFLAYQFPRKKITHSVYINCLRYNGESI
ncbi:hypothetical protein EGI32_12575 [Ferruginibacter sp. HRS2-29]|nr:hypothetical protein [Ferruginibacter sp. HRS2-29]